MGFPDCCIALEQSSLTHLVHSLRNHHIDRAESSVQSNNKSLLPVKDCTWCSLTLHPPRGRALSIQKPQMPLHLSSLSLAIHQHDSYAFNHQHGHITVERNPHRLNSHVMLTQARRSTSLILQQNRANPRVTTVMVAKSLAVTTVKAGSTLTALISVAPYHQCLYGPRR